MRAKGWNHGCNAVFKKKARHHLALPWSGQGVVYVNACRARFLWAYWFLETLMYKVLVIKALLRGHCAASAGRLHSVGSGISDTTKLLPF